MLKKMSRLAAVGAVAVIATGAATLTSAHAAPFGQQQAAPYGVNEPDGSLFKPLTGFYVGAYGGYDWAHVHTSGLSTSRPEGADYGGFAGYSLDQMLSRYSGVGLTAAIEGHYGYSNARDSDSIGGTDATTRKSNEWGVDFRPGFSALNQALAPVGIKPYAIIGYDRTKFAGSDGGVSASAHFNGLAAGAGAELFSIYHIGVRADYEHVWYNENNGSRPGEDEVRIGTALHF